MWIWMYATRIPAMRAAQVDVAELSRTGRKLELPPEVSRVADDYNHLHEQPTIFYATALAAQVAGVRAGRDAGADARSGRLKGRRRRGAPNRAPV